MKGAGRRRVGSGKHATTSTVGLLWIGIWLVCNSLCCSSLDQSKEVGDVICDPNKIADGDPLAHAIAELAKEMLTAGPILASRPSQIFCYYATYIAKGTGGTATAYGSVSCNLQDAVGCQNCLQDVVGVLSTGCPDAVGAQATLTNCFMRIEPYRYCD